MCGFEPIHPHFFVVGKQQKRPHHPQTKPNLLPARKQTDDLPSLSLVRPTKSPLSKTCSTVRLPFLVHSTRKTLWRSLALHRSRLSLKQKNTPFKPPATYPKTSVQPLPLFRTLALFHIHNICSKINTAPSFGRFTPHPSPPHAETSCQSAHTQHN